MAKAKTTKVKKIELTTDVLTETDVKKVLANVKRRAMTELEEMVFDATDYRADKDIDKIVKELIKEIKPDIKEFARKRLMEHVNEIKFYVHVDY